MGGVARAAIIARIGSGRIIAFYGRQMQTPISICPGCGLEMPATGGTTHRYLNSSPECWSVYGEVLASEYEDIRLMRRAHQLTVDAYPAQHPGGSHPDRSIGVHLAGLHLILERETAHSAISQLRQALGDTISEWPHFKPASDLGDITVFDVAVTSSGSEHIAAVDRWATSVWNAWSPHHAEVRSFVGMCLI